MDAVAGMTDYLSGIYALAEPEKLAIRRWSQSDDWVNSYMTNGTLYCIPEKKANGWQCVNPRRDYQNDVRLNLTSTNVVEIRAAYTNFSQGIAKICALPEYFPGDVRNEYNGQAFFAEMKRNGANVEISAYRQYSTAEDGRTNLAATVTNAYVEGESVSLQVGSTNVQVYYGTGCVIDAPHGLTNAVEVFSHGVYPHYEFLNASNTTTAVVQMKALKCRTQSGFGTSE